jgi:tryptophan-rich sensory protein
MQITNIKFTVWHAVAIYFLVNGINWVSAGLVGDFEFYNSFVQPSVAPPDWLFAPMWFFLNVTSLWALYRSANTADGNDKKLFLWLEGIFWALFATFAFMYFGDVNWLKILKIMLNFTCISRSTPSCLIFRP